MLAQGICRVKHANFEGCEIKNLNKNLLLKMCYGDLKEDERKMNPADASQIEPTQTNFENTTHYSVDAFI